MVDLVSPDPDLAMKAGRQIVHWFRSESKLQGDRL